MKSDILKKNYNFYVVKLIPMNRVYKLPNFRIFNLEDLDNFVNYSLKNDLFEYKEIWFCKTRVDEGVYSISGRITYSDSGVQTVEQLWNCSARIIEEFNEESNFTYLRASRPGWGYRYMIEKLLTPNGNFTNKEVLLTQFWNSVKEVEKHREQIEIFCDYLEQFQFKIFSLEYKIINGKFSIIDWDSPNDLCVLR